MFGISKEQLVKGLCRISTRLCCYMGSRCDCKYMQNTNDVLSCGSEATGCPESAMASHLINAMTTQEFYAIARRAGIEVRSPEEPEVEIGIFMKNLQEQRDGARQQDTHRFATAVRLAKKAAKK